MIKFPQQGSGERPTSQKPKEWFTMTKLEQSSNLHQGQIFLISRTSSSKSSDCFGRSVARPAAGQRMNFNPGEPSSSQSLPWCPLPHGSEAQRTDILMSSQEDDQWLCFLASPDVIHVWNMGWSPAIICLWRFIYRIRNQVPAVCYLVTGTRNTDWKAQFLT